MNDPSSLLTSWANFYVMTGSSSAALIGLMFVVITLVTGTERARRSHEGTANFSTPTVVHFAGVLLLSAIISAPWHAAVYPCVILALAGLFGAAYVVRVAYRIKRMPGYTADTEDRIWHTLLPLLAYGAIFAGAIMLLTLTAQALFLLASAVVMFLFIGIHNAWDIVTVIAIDSPEQSPSPNDSAVSK